MTARAISELYYNTYCAHKELSLTCVARARFELLSYMKDYSGSGDVVIR